MDSIFFGCDIDRLFPCPSYPLPLKPTVKTSPCLVRTAICSFPAAMCITFISSKNRTYAGAFLSCVSPLFKSLKIIIITLTKTKFSIRILSEHIDKGRRRGRRWATVIIHTFLIVSIEWWRIVLEVWRSVLVVVVQRKLTYVIDGLIDHLLLVSVRIRLH